MAPLHVDTLNVKSELRDYLASRVSTLPLYQETMADYLASGVFTLPLYQELNMAPLHVTTLTVFLMP